MSDLFDVSGSTALVTGGSRGIWLMIARGLVQAGARVIVSSRKSNDVEAAARELAAVGDCHAIPGDVSTQQGAAELAQATRERFGELDILVNNAGTNWGAPLEEYPASGWERSPTRTSKASFISRARCCPSCGPPRMRRIPRA